MTYRKILSEYLADEDAKSLDPSGERCLTGPRGFLTRRPGRVRSITHIGKEAKQLDDTQAGLVLSQ